MDTATASPSAMFSLINKLPALFTLGAYIWSRAKAKANPEAKPGWKTSEFWLTTIVTTATVLKDALLGPT
jgi:hypothetical protein